jgi:Transglycosylase SLT domain
MFLFTDKAPVTAKPSVLDGLPHAAPLKQASRATGVSFDYLAKTAERESGFNPQAKAPTSSATGMFQFLEQTWLGMVKQEGGKLGLGQEAEAISSSNGRLTVNDTAMRQKILGLRQDPGVSAMMAGAFAAKNGQSLQESLGRKPSEGELYLAHFLGPNGARDLITLAEKTPDAKAATSFREAAAANRPIFFDRTGRAKSAAEVYSAITGSFGQKAVVQPQSAENAAAKAQNMFRVKGDSKGLHGLFRSNGEPVADAVKQAWGNIGQQHKIVGEQRVPFFPREKGGSTTVNAVSSIETATVAAGRGSVTVPLPQQRPSGLGRLGSVGSVGSPGNTGSPGGLAALGANGGKSSVDNVSSLTLRTGPPLDLMHVAKTGRIR